ncbi:GNAT family N-acetyltransferase [Streptomyces sp. ISL-11]|uniref:GNAT family N-acetyltransferase n=1 Tax=Streptomyces sp. ISL-11 TaxID=2819174 RepID=UPI001BECC2A7|nr:GNAT family N-acetyltransferase [Streptomyces sp. ISL-11]MBT2382291.1 GNAT family N-acetyltransferase [Streptomyces sp. ISL-11]
MRIRDAHAADWPAIWPLVREVAAAGRTYTFPRDIGEDHAREMWMLTAPSRTVVAVDDDGTFLGTAKMNPNHMGPASHIASASFMVRPEHSGRGVGRALGEETLAWARAEGYRAMQFNAVVETNTRAVALWKSLGFTVIGTLPEGYRLPDGSYTGLHIMHLAL